MLRRVFLSVLAAAALAGTAGLAWLPMDFTPRAEARPDPEPRTSTSKMIASEAAFFVTFRPADFTSDELIKTVFEGLDREMERGFRTPLADVERVSLAVVPGGTVTIIHTHKAYDQDKLKTGFVGDRFRFDDKDRKDGPPRKREVMEKKVRGKVIYYSGEWARWTTGFCPLDKTTFAFGEVAALQRLLEARGTATPEMTQAVALSGKHSLVLALDGKRLAGLVKHEREERERERHERMKRFEKERKFEEKKFEEKKFEEEQVSLRQDKDEKPSKDKKDKKDAEADVDDLFNEFRGPEAIILLPFRPFLKAKIGVLTLDVKKTYTLTAKATAQSKEDVEDLETAMKMGLYVVRDFPRVMAKMERGEMGFLDPLAAPISKAFKQAKVERKGNVVSTTVTLTPDAGLAKKVKEAKKETERKREERYKDKDKGFKEKGKKFEDKKKD